MQNPIETQHTSEDSTSDEIKEIRTLLDEHLQNRKVDIELLKRAWHTAHQVATFLYKEFGAEQVAVFGSLSDGSWFSKDSDIDIAVWGLLGDTYLDAVWETNRYSTEFKVDLVNYHNANGQFKNRIQSQGITIKNSETDFYASVIDHIIQNTLREKSYLVDKRKLIQRISDELRKIEKTVEEIRLRLQRIETASTEDLDDLKALIAIRITIFYTGFENIFKRIAREIDSHLPKGKDWHKEILHQMTKTFQFRPIVISSDSVDTLSHILKFRHRFRYIYTFELELDGVLENAHRVCKISDNLINELNVFIKWLEKEQSDL